MPRNVAKPLTTEQYHRVLGYTRELADRFNHDESVTLNYVKRNGSDSSSTGKVEGFVGNAMMDTFSVQIVDVVKGIRTINMVGIKEIV